MVYMFYLAYIHQVQRAKKNRIFLVLVERGFIALRSKFSTNKTPNLSKSF